LAFTASAPAPDPSVTTIRRCACHGAAPTQDAGGAPPGNRTMPTREEILNKAPTQKLAHKLADAVLDTDEIEEMLANAERVRALKVSPETPIDERMARLGCPKNVCDKVAELMEVLSTLRAGRPLPERLERFIKEYDTAEQSADDQPAVLVNGRGRALALANQKQRDGQACPRSFLLDKDAWQDGEATTAVGPGSPDPAPPCDGRRSATGRAVVDCPRPAIAAGWREGGGGMTEERITGSLVWTYIGPSLQRSIGLGLTAGLPILATPFRCPTI
jgi:hypothetical protein